MPVKMEPNSIIFANLGIKPNGPVHAFFTETCYKAMDKYVPKDNGDLRDEVTLTSDTITYEMPYATYQYKGIREDGTHAINPNNYTTSGTGPYWDEKMWTTDKDRVIRQVQRFVDRGAK